VPFPNFTAGERHKRLTPLESTPVSTLTHNSLKIPVPTKNPVVNSPENIRAVALAKLQWDARQLTCKRLLVRILQFHGPRTTSQLFQESLELRKVWKLEPFTISTVTYAVRELSLMGLIVKANGGWNIFNFKDLQ
jgi:hypothetical protein